MAPVISWPSLVPVPGPVPTGTGRPAHSCYPALPGQCSVLNQRIAQTRAILLLPGYFEIYNFISSSSSCTALSRLETVIGFEFDWIRGPPLFVHLAQFSRLTSFISTSGAFRIKWPFQVLTVLCCTGTRRTGTAPVSYFTVLRQASVRN